MRDKSILSLKIMDNENFLSLSKNAQLLYVHLNCRADDEGFISNVTGIMRNIQIQPKFLKELEKSRFILMIDGIPVIKHWGKFCTIRKDRIKPTIYQEQKKKLAVKSDGSYTEGGQLADKCQPNGRQMSTKRQTNVNQTADECQTVGGQTSAQTKLNKAKLNKNNLKDDDNGIYIYNNSPSDSEDSSSSGATDRKCIMLFKSFGRDATEHDKEAYYWLSRSTDEEVITYAFESAHDQGHSCQWEYIKGILRNLQLHGCRTMEDVLEHEAERDITLGKLY